MTAESDGFAHGRSRKQGIDGSLACKGDTRTYQKGTKLRPKSADLTSTKTFEYYVMGVVHIMDWFVMNYEMILLWLACVTPIKHPHHDQQENILDMLLRLISQMRFMYANFRLFNSQAQYATSSLA